MRCASKFGLPIAIFAKGGEGGEEGGREGEEDRKTAVACREKHMPASRGKRKDGRDGEQEIGRTSG